MVHRNKVLGHAKSQDNMSTALSSPQGSFSAHGKLHKRGNSASAMGLQPLSPVSVRSADAMSSTYGHNMPNSPLSLQSFHSVNDSWDGVMLPPNSASASNKSAPKIKPYLRKLSTKDSNSLDLSRPAAENETLANINLSEVYMANYRSASEVPFTPVGGSRHRHRRSTSNTSQFSTSSSQRPTQPFKHPMRQNPRPYTPPVGQSYPNSVTENEADDILSEDEFHYRQHIFDPSRRSGSVSSATAPVLSLHTSTSFTKLGGQSQTNLSVSPAGANGTATRQRGDTLRSFDTAVATSPSSTASFDKVKSFLSFNADRDSPVDPATRAREIQAARAAYREREEAKERKAEKEALKAADRESRRQIRQEERTRRKSECHSRSVSRNVSNEKLPRPSVGGRQYSDYAQTHDLSMPARVETGFHRTEATPAVSKTKAARSTWLTFVTWFRTRIFRLGKKMGTT